MPQAFISYSHQDAAFVSHLQVDLHASNFDTWRDVHNLRAGDRWPRKLGDAIDAAPIFILVWSSNAAPSDFVELEWTIAVALKRTISIVALDQSLVPATLRPYETKRTTDANEAAHWLLNAQSPAAAPAAAQPVLQALSAMPDNVSVKQIASLLAVRSNVSSRGKLPFVGRQDLVAQLDSWLEDTRQESVVVLHGAPGAGKSELAREFARLRRQRYPGGTFAIDASSNAFALQLASLGEKLLSLPFPPDMNFDDRGLRTFLSLSHEPVLLIYDNVVSFEKAQPWLPYAGMPCHVLITTLLDRPTHMWECLEVNPLTPAHSLELVDKLTDGKLDRATAQSIAAHSGGLPVQILPHAAALADARRRSRNRQSHLPIAIEAGNSFRAAYNQLDQSARLLLHAAAFFNTQHIPSGEITQHLVQGLEWTEADVDRVFDCCFDLHLLQGAPEPRMHHLFAAFIRETPLAPEGKVALARVTKIQANRFLELAKQISANPADLNQVTLLLDYPLTPGIWSEMGSTVTIEEGELAGSALGQVGRFEEARPWFERAVEEKEKGDVHGQFDHAGLGISLGSLGYSYSSTGRFDEAMPWFERAVAEKEKGDVHGRVDHESLGNSLNAVGDCYRSTGRFEEALPWFERAVAETEKGDAGGRVNHDSLAIGLHQMGDCYSRTGRFEEAFPWFARAVAEAEIGDAHGRVDHESLGRSLGQVGDCYSRTRRFDEARPWYERALAAAKKGDLHGRVDHASLGLNLLKVGYCYSSTGYFEEALPWLERAVAEAEKGDVLGRVDHESLGCSLDHVGDCYSSTGRFDEARLWFERAVAKKKKGDVYGRVDHDSLGISLHQVGDCCRSTGSFEQALPWYERAVAEKEIGDPRGRVDHASQGISLYQVGNCYRSTGRFEEALSWYERAVAEYEKGDLDGRVNYTSLALSLHAVGFCYINMVRFERAVQEAEKGNMLGLVQSETLTGIIQDLVGCFQELGRSEDALTWEKRYASAAST